MNKYYLCDLHVHTPSSTDYKGKKDIDEYIKLLRKAKDNKIDLIAITDHLSVDGYRIIMEARKRINDTVQYLSQRNFKIDPDIQKESEILNTIHILMGIELKVSPGIHYIVIFKEFMQIENVIKFISDITNNDNQIQYGSPDYMININSIGLFNAVRDRFGDNAFIFAPHVDSTSGVVQSLKEFGSERINILKNENLLCLSFSQDSSREYIKKSLLPTVIKERKKPLHFIQNSDYHGGIGEDIGSFNFAIDRDEGRLCFDTLIKRFGKSKDIRTTLDTAAERYKEFTDSELKEGNKIIQLGLVSIKTLESPDFVDALSKTICAIANSEKGLVELEVQSIGDADIKLDIDELLRESFKILGDRIDRIPSELSCYSFQTSKSKHKVILRFEKLNRLSLYNGLCYAFDDNYNINIATANQVEAIVARKIYGNLGRAKEYLIDDITASSAKFKRSLLNYSLFYKVAHLIEVLSDAKIKFLSLKKLPEDILGEFRKQAICNGMFNGDTIYIQELDLKGGRQKDSYLRFTAPAFNVNLPDNINPEIVKEKSILIIEGGGAYLADENKKIISTQPALLLSIKDEHVQYEILLSFLKSTFVQWLIYKIHNYNDLFEFMLNTGGKRVPIISDIENIDATPLLSFINNVVLEERKILQYLAKNYDNKDLSDDALEKIKKEIQRHNNACDNYCRGIDKFFYDLLKIDKKAATLICEEINYICVYDYGYLKNIDEIYK